MVVNKMHLHSGTQAHIAAQISRKSAYLRVLPLRTLSAKSTALDSSQKIFSFIVGLVFKRYAAQVKLLVHPNCKYASPTIFAASPNCAEMPHSFHGMRWTQPAYYVVRTDALQFSCTNSPGPIYVTASI